MKKERAAMKTAKETHTQKYKARLRCFIVPRMKGRFNMVILKITQEYDHIVFKFENIEKAVDFIKVLYEHADKEVIYELRTETL